MKLTLEQLENRCTPATITISGVDSGDIDGVPFATANLTGTNYADTIIFQPGAYLTGSLNGGGGVDTVTFAAWSDAFSFAVGAAGSNNGGTIAGTFGSLPFASCESLVGGSGDDSFTLSSLKGLTGGIDGQGGSDTLSYAAWATNVQANLLLGTATALGGVSGIENVLGGSRDDRLFGDDGANVLAGNAGHDVLIGNGGGDTLHGGAGRNLLVGGAGADTLTADAASAGDILIGCATTYDADLTSLNRIMSEWTSTRTYAQRIANITAGTGNTAGVTLTAAQCVPDGAANTLQGNSGSVKNWYFAGLSDSLAGNFAGELVEALP